MGPRFDATCITERASLKLTFPRECRLFLLLWCLVLEIGTDAVANCHVGSRSAPRTKRFSTDRSETQARPPPTELRNNGVHTGQKSPNFRRRRAPLQSSVGTCTCTCTCMLQPRQLSCRRIGPCGSKKCSPESARRPAPAHARAKPKASLRGGPSTVYPVDRVDGRLGRPRSTGRLQS